MVIQKKNDVSYYLNLPWTFTLEQEKKGNVCLAYIVRVNEWPGVATDAPTISEAFERIYEALALAITMSLEEDDRVPEPQHAKAL